MSSAPNNSAVTDSKRAKITAEHKAEAQKLFALWKASTTRRSQAEFGEKYGLGNQANVGHYLHARSALNPKAAAAFAAELGCKVEDFSPRVAAEVRALGNPSLALDLDLDFKLEPVAKTAFLPGFEALSIPVLANSGSMGPGNEQLHDEVVVGRLTVSPQWVARTIKPTALENLRFIHGYGDSMEPTFIDGDVLLVDIGVQDPKIDGVYVLEANDRIYIKRVRQRMDGAFEISSDNPTVKTVDVLDGSTPVNVRGRVVWAWNGKKM